MAGSRHSVDGKSDVDGAAKRKSAWKRVTSIYSAPFGATADKESLANDDTLEIWDNNDYDFQRQIALDQSKSRMSANMPSPDALVEEIDTPAEAGSAYFVRSSEALPSSSSTPALSSTTFGTGSTYSLHSVVTTTSTPSSAWQRNPAFAPRTVAIKRPASAAGGASLFSSPSFSNMSSEGSALTYPSPGTSMTEGRKLNRLSGQRAHFLGPSAVDGGGGSLESSPTSFNFAAAQAQSAPTTVVEVPQRQTSIVRVGDWTQEQIDAPDEQQSSHSSRWGPKALPSISSLDGGQSKVKSDSAGRFAAPLSSLKSREDASAMPNATLGHPVTSSLPPTSRSNLTEAELIRHEALTFRSNVPPSPIISQPAKGSTRTNDLRPTPPSSPHRIPTRRSSQVAASVTSDDASGAVNQKGLFSSLKERFAGKHIQTSDSTTNNDAVANNTPSIRSYRRRSRLTNASPSKSVFGSDDIDGFADAEARRGESFDVLSVDGNTLEKVHSGSYTQTPKRASKHADTPDTVFRIGRDSHSMRSSLDDRAQNVHLGSRDELPYDASGRTSSMSKGSANWAPPRPVRRDNGRLIERPDHFANAAALSSRASFESAFNAAHDRRWSTVGQAQGHVRRGSDVTGISGSTSGNALRQNVEMSHFSRARSNSNSWTKRGALVEMDHADTMSSQRFLPTRHTALNRSEKHHLPKLTSEMPHEEVDPKLPKSRPSSRLSRLLGRKPSLAGVKISRPSQPGDEMAEDPFADRTVTPITQTLSNTTPMNYVGTDDYSPQSDHFASQSQQANRISSGSDISGKVPYANFDKADGTEMRPSRSTSDMTAERLRSQDWRNASSTSLASAISISSQAHKRPTFGLDLQPDAAAAFDSIPLPATPELRHRSRNQMPITSPAEVVEKDDPSQVASSTLADTTKHLRDMKLEDKRKHGRVPPVQSGREADDLPADLPSDVEESEDLLDFEDVAHVGPTTSDRHTDESHTRSHDTFGSGASDEVELLEDEDSATRRQARAKDSTMLANKALTEEGSARRSLDTSLSSYRFPAQASVNATRPARPAHRDEKELTDELSAILASNNGTHRRTLSHSSDPTWPAPILAPYLSRPSSSNSFV